MTRKCFFEILYSALLLKSNTGFLFSVVPINDNTKLSITVSGYETVYRYVTFTAKDELWYEVNGNPDRWYYALLSYAQSKGLTPAQITSALNGKKNWIKFKEYMTRKGL